MPDWFITDVLILPLLRMTTATKMIRAIRRNFNVIWMKSVTYAPNILLAKIALSWILAVGKVALSSYLGRTDSMLLDMTMLTKAAVLTSGSLSLVLTLMR